MLLKLILLFIIGLTYAQTQTGLISGRIDAVTNLITLAGYTSETHRVETEDGYLLKVHRIFPRADKERKGPALLVHGLFGTSADYVFTGPNVALAYLLSNEGYDVWLGNVRGSKYSMKHRRLDPLSREFWQFSFHEIGYFDLPAMINYILAATQKPSLFYVGHNQGTTVLLVMLTTRPEFNQKILNAQLMAPIAFMNYLHPVLSLGGDDTLRASQLLNNYNFASLITFANAIIDTYCTDRNTNSLNFCLNLWSFAFGRNLNQAEFDPKLLLKIPDHISPTASTRQWDHYLQLAQTGKFRQFDIRGNSVGSASPAEYNLLNVKAPLYFYHAAEDLIVSRLDVEHLKTFVTASVREYRIIPNWNHFDFLLSANARPVLYNSMVTAMNNEQLDFIGQVKNFIGTIG